MKTVRAADPNRHCECGGPLTVISDDWGLGWECQMCGNLAVLEKITRADIELVCENAGIHWGLPVHILETLRQEEYPARGLSSDLELPEEPGVLDFGFPVCQWIEVGSQGFCLEVVRFSYACALPLFRRIHKKKWGRGFRQIPMIDSRRVLTVSTATVGTQHFVNAQSYSDVLNRLDIDREGMLR